MQRLFSIRSVFPRLFARMGKVTLPLLGMPRRYPCPEPAVERFSLNPIVEDLRAYQTNAERAHWLLRVPFGFVYMRHSEITAVLREAGYDAGETFVALIVAYLSAKRDDRGVYPYDMILPIQQYMAVLHEDATSAREDA